LFILTDLRGGWRHGCGGDRCVDVAEDVVEFADRGEFDRVLRGEGIGFFLIEEFLKSIAELVGEFEEGEVVDLLEAESFV
jgi:hypothetical protein